MELFRNKIAANTPAIAPDLSGNDTATHAN